MTPARILQNALSGLDSGAMWRLSEQTGVPHPAIMRAAGGAHGQPTGAVYHLKLCLALGVHPVTGEAIPARLVDVDTRLFAMAVKMSRFAKVENSREAARAMKLSATTWCRIETGDPRSFDSMLTACRYGQLDPLNYVTGVSREASGNLTAAA